MLNYRSDIDGLRALAVVPVVLFHADATLFSGGFIGVDVFFVVSGYLITAMLLQDIAARRFSILDFYLRRARRILPALLAVVAVTLIASFLLLLPNELEQAAKATKRIAVFASNHLFWQTQDDYWQQHVLANQPLLHTWSLAVEEQFYLIMPLLLLLCIKLKQRLGVLTALLGTASLMVSQYWLTHQTAAAFYLLPSRAFELLIGVMLAIALLRGNKQLPSVNQWIGSAGLVFIGISIFYYHDKLPFPGVAALLPCLGAAAIIYAGAANHPDHVSWINRLLKMRGLVFIGLISYSLYLWHWPILVLVRSVGWYAWGLPKPPVEIVLTGIVLLSWASWRWIEQPFRARKVQVDLHGNAALLPPTRTHARPFILWRFPVRHQGIAATTALGALVLCWGFGAGVRQMIHHQPLPPMLVKFNQETSVTPGARCEGNVDPDVIRAGKAGCLLGGTGFSSTPVFTVLGDSHARMWADGLDLLGKEHQKPMLLLAYSSCTPLVDYIPPSRHECKTIFNNLLDYVARSPIRQVVLAGYWIDAIENMNVSDGSGNRFKTRLAATVEHLQDAGKIVYIMPDIPDLDSEKVLRERFMQSLRSAGTAVASMNLDSHRTRQAEVNAAISAMQSTHHIHVLNPDAAICPATMCMVAEGGSTLYRDKHHLTDAASRRFRKIFEPLFFNDF